MSFFSYPHRTICAVLEEMRNIDKAKSYGSLLGLIEEVQTLANRMEAGLDTQKDYFKARDEIKKMKKEYKKLQEKVKKLKKEVK